MGNFQDFDLSAEKKNVAYLDRCAVEYAGRVASSSGYTLTTFPEDVGDWSFRWVGTRGTGNCGTLVLKAKSGRTRKLLWEGRKIFYMEKGFDEIDAEALASAPVAYKFEEEVVDVLLDLSKLEHWEDLCEIVDSPVFTWREVDRLRVCYGIKSKLEEMSAHRRTSVRELAQALYKVNLVA